MVEKGGPKKMILLDVGSISKKVLFGLAVKMNSDCATAGSSNSLNVGTCSPIRWSRCFIQLFVKWW